jgi:putative two-component system response regulator
MKTGRRTLLRTTSDPDELESSESVLCALAKSIEAKDPSTQGHCERLAAYAVHLGAVLGVAEKDQVALWRGGFLHDLGKLAVPDSILLKPGPLDSREWKVMEQHPRVGESICSSLRSLTAVLPIIRHHHERWDGAGYPDGLAEEAIPLAARILQVVDIFDALTTARPYRPALPPGEALWILRKQACRGWSDPAVVKVFARIVQHGGSPEDGRRVNNPRLTARLACL